MLNRAMLLALALLTSVTYGFSQVKTASLEHSHGDLLRFEAFLNITTNKAAAISSRYGQQAAFGKAFGLTSEMSSLVVNDNAVCLAKLAPVNEAIRASVASFRAQFPDGRVPSGKDFSPPASTHNLQMKKDQILTECLTSIESRFSESNRAAAVHAILYPGDAE